MQWSHLLLSSLQNKTAKLLEKLKNLKLKNVKTNNVLKLVLSDGKETIFVIGDAMLPHVTGIMETVILKNMVVYLMTNVHLVAPMDGKEIFTVTMLAMLLLVIGIMVIVILKLTHPMLLMNVIQDV